MTIGVHFISEVTLLKSIEGHGCEHERSNISRRCMFLLFNNYICWVSQYMSFDALSLGSTK